MPGTAALTCTGVPINATCLVVPASVPLGTGTATLVVTVATGVATASLATRPGNVWLALLLPVGALCLRRRRTPDRTMNPAIHRLLGIIILCCLGLASGCATGRTIPDIPTVAAPSTPTPTPSGTSTIVVSATSAGLTRTVNLTLTVQ